MKCTCGKKQKIYLLAQDGGPQIYGSFSESANYTKHCLNEFKGFLQKFLEKPAAPHAKKLITLGRPHACQQRTCQRCQPARQARRQSAP